MEEIVKTRLPLLAWIGQDGRYRLIYNGVPIANVAINEEGYGVANYHNARWIIEPENSGSATFRRAGARQPSGTLVRTAERGKPAETNRLEEGRINMEGRGYRYLRDGRKVPPRVTITGEENQPLLQFHQEDEEHGRIQIDDQRAASSPDFEKLVLWGLQLYLSASRDPHTPTLRPPKPSIRPSRTTSRAIADSGGTPPAAPPEDKYYGDRGDGEGASWVTVLAGLAALFWLAQAWRLTISSKRRQV